MKEKKMKKEIGRKELPKAEGQTPFVKKETKAEEKLEPKPKATPVQMRDTAKKIVDLAEERRACVSIRRFDPERVEVEVLSMGPWTPFDLGALKVLEEAQSRGLLFKMSNYLFSNSAGTWIERAMAANATEERKKQRAERNAVFLKFVEVLQKEGRRL